MKKFNSIHLEKAIKKNKIFLVICLILLILTLSLIGLGIYTSQKELPEPIALNDLISKNSDKEEVFSYIDVNIEPYLFAVYETDGIEESNKFYLVMDANNYLYVIYASPETYNKLSADDIESNPVRIYGVSKKIESDIRGLAIGAYNELLEEDYLTEENFSTYVGLLYLNTENSVSDSSPYYVLALITGIFFLTFFIVYLVNHLKTRKILKKYSQSELDKIGLEIYETHDNPYEKMGLYLTKNYVIDVSNGLMILKYEEIIWAYPFIYRQNGIVVNENIKVLTTDSKTYDIASTKFFSKNRNLIIEEILIRLKEKNANILIGHTKKNKKLAKEFVKKCK